MKGKFLIGVIGLSAAVASAQVSDLEAVKRQLKEATEAFQKAIEQQRLVIESLSNKVSALEAQQLGATNRLVANAMPTGAVTNESNERPQPERQWSPTDPLRLLGKGQNYINVSFDGLFAAGASTAKDINVLEPGGHDPNQRGFTVQNLETVFEGKVDP